MATVLQDLLYKRETCNVSGTLANEWSDCTDAWGGIERHVTLYNTASNVLVDKFFSLAHDPSRSVPFQLFENRTACVHVALSTLNDAIRALLMFNDADRKSAVPGTLPCCTSLSTSPGSEQPTPFLMQSHHELRITSTSKARGTFL